MAGGRRTRSAAAALTALALLTACTARVEGSASPAGTRGADGYGDPYFPLDGNGGYDVGSYSLELRFDPDTDALSGTATVVATATQSLSSFNLDLFGFEVSSVTVDGEAADVARDGGELTVTPAADVPDGSEFTTVVAYEGVPEPLDDALGTAGFIQTDDGALAVGQPDVAASWFPVNDHPADAAAVAVSITVPEGVEGISNGELVDSSSEDGWTTWQWAAEEPMAPYLVMLAVGEFQVEEYEEDGVRYWDAVDPALADEDARGSATVLDVARESLGRQAEVIAVLEEWFGPYPFTVAGGVVDDVDIGFALENQTRPVYGPSFFDDPRSGELVVVHELAHQWAGDSVRLAGWQHIWLNEGFATYAEWLWADAQGTSTPQEEFDRIAGVPAGSTFWRAAIGDPGPASGELFSQAVYLRGAMTVHALRTEVGEEAFAGIVREWFSAEAGEAVTTDDFVALAEEVSGQQLDELFAEWLGEGKPASLG